MAYCHFRCRRSAGRYVLSRALSMTAALAAQALMPALAHAQNAAVRVFDLPADNLANALTALGRQAQVQVLFNPDTAAGMQAGAVSGQMTVQAALDRLLAHSGLAAVRSGSGFLVRSPAGAIATGAVTLPPTQVTVPVEPLPGELPQPYAGGQVARGGRVGLLGNQDVMNTPFSITAYTQERLEDVQAKRLTDAVADDPSVRDHRGVAYYDGFSIRGFPVYASDVSYDGVYGVLPWFGIPAEIAERVDILKGPTQLLTGMSPDGSVGGSINIAPKRAPDEPLNRVTLDYQSRGEWGTHFDLGRRFGADHAVGARVNGVLRAGDQPWDRSHQQFGLASLGMDYRGQRLRLSADLGYQANDIKAPLSEDLAIDSGWPIPAAPAASSNIEQDWNKIRDRSVFGLLKGEYDVNDDWTVSAALGGNQMNFLYAQSAQTIFNANGDVKASPYYYAQHWNTWSGQIGANGRFFSGPVKHRLTLQASQLASMRSLQAEDLLAYASNLYHPVSVERPTFPRLASYSNLPKYKSQTLSSLAFSDDAALWDDRLHLIVGGRQQRVVEKKFDPASGDTNEKYDASRFSPALAVIIKPAPQLSFYGNYIEGLSPGEQAPPAAANAGKIFPPYVSRQYEGGVKMDFGRIASTLAVFQIIQPSGFLDPATHAYRADAQQKNRGVEFQTFGELGQGLRLIGGVALMRGRLAKTAGGANDGKVAPGTPGRQLNLSAEWDVTFLPGLTLSGRVINTSKQYYDPQNTQSIPGWTRLDVGARYTAGRLSRQPLVFRLNINNLQNRGYYSSTNAGTLARGAPRTFLLSVTADF